MGKRIEKRQKNLKTESLLLRGIEEFLRFFARGPLVYTWPNRAFLMWFFDKHKVTKRQRYYAGQVLNRMVAEKLISMSRNGGLQLSIIAQKKLADIRFNDFTLVKPERWDGKFRIIIFDIATDKNNIRMAFRRQLESWGFILLQRSVWVYPYECREVVDLVKNHYGVKSEVIYITAETIENEEELKRKFGLN